MVLGCTEVFDVHSETHKQITGYTATLQPDKPDSALEMAAGPT